MRAWCKEFGLPGDATFALHKFGEGLATSLAVAWCERLEYFYAASAGAAKKDAEFTADMVSACPPPRCLGEITGEAKHVRQRLAEIMAMTPKAASTSSSSSSAKRR